MIIYYSTLKKKVFKRLPEIPEKEVSTYIDTLVDIIRERLVASIPIIIGNFGTLSRKISHARKAYNVSRREWNIINPTYITLIPNISFIKYLKHPENRKYLKQRIMEQSKRLFLDNKKRNKRIQRA